MITLYVLGSGSRGNCCAVESDGIALLIDAGFSAREIERRAQRAGLDLGQVKGIALTHEHGDHACGAPLLARRLDVPVLTAPGTWMRLAGTMEETRHRPLGLCARVELGPFSIEACPTSHDAAEPLAIVVRGPRGTSVGIAYDLGRPTAAVRYLLRDLTAIVLEANHDEVQLRTSDYPPVVQRRISGSSGHLSNRAAAELLAELHHPGLLTVVLAHLSQLCNTAAEARAAVAPALRRAGFRGALHVADQDMPLAPILVVQKAGVQLSLAL
ncbi:MAG TPA: MBL fold metallo-hydrolase [Gemmatimonadales bacterium]|nr:MBL fold metallo-hydrolase [Gemmatimonadales bacterium]